jgi:hypothetical protein
VTEKKGAREAMTLATTITQEGEACYTVRSSDGYECDFPNIDVAFRSVAKYGNEPVELDTQSVHALGKLLDHYDASWRAARREAGSPVRVERQQV